MFLREASQPTLFISLLVLDSQEPEVRVANFVITNRRKREREGFSPVALLGEVLGSYLPKMMMDCGRREGERGERRVPAIETPLRAASSKKLGTEYE